MNLMNINVLAKFFLTNFFFLEINPASKLAEHKKAFRNKGWRLKFTIYLILAGAK